MTVEFLHVIPIADLRDHEPDLDCWCQPYVYEEDEDYIIHNSLDGREDFQYGIRKPS